MIDDLFTEVYVPDKHYYLLSDRKLKLLYYHRHVSSINDTAVKTIRAKSFINYKYVPIIQGMNEETYPELFI